MTMTMRKLCWICGGSGAFTGLCGICEVSGIELDVITTIFDSGGAQGVILANDPQAVALADPMKCLVALATDEITAKLYRHRFNDQGSGGLSNQTVGNVEWYGLFKMGLDPRAVIAYMHKRLGVRSHHRVEPVAVDRSDVCICLEDNTEIRGEKDIDIPKHDGSQRVVSARLDPQVSTTLEAFNAIVQADVVVIGPGDLYSSLVPCLLPNGVSDALKHTRAKLVCVVGLMTKFGETYGFKASDFVQVLEQYIQRKMDYIICNTGVPSPRALKAYEKEMAVPMEHDLYDDARAIGADLLSEGQDHVLRHDSKRLALLLATLCRGEVVEKEEVAEEVA